MIEPRSYFWLMTGTASRSRLVDGKIAKLVQDQIAHSIFFNLKKSSSAISLNLP